MTETSAFNLGSLPSKFFDVSFNLLMQKRVHKVLLICSNYDAFILEEDGRIDEQLHIEYFSQNLRHSPQLYKANSAGEAFSILNREKIDLVIEMLNIAEIDTFELASKIKTQFPAISIVVLTHFSREVSLKLQYEDLSHIDHVFCWLGNADLLLAIIKLFEDRMNAPFDVEEVGVQAILLVEDSVRYLSSYLPILYKIVLQQAREFMMEALNENEKMLRMRGRPKILVATNYDEAMKLYTRYKDNLLGVITDISYKKSATERDQKEKLGLKFTSYIRREDQFLPILIQSSDIENEKYATKINAGFIHKYSDSVSMDLQNFIVKQFGFGDFVFRNPQDEKELYRASDLPSLQQMIQIIPDHILEYHANRNEISKWLNARALFPIAKLFKHLKIDDFPNLDMVRSYIDHTIAMYRSGKGKTVIAEFDRSRFSKYLVFSRIGGGSFGGKARGLAFVNNLIEKYNLRDKYEQLSISIPRTVVICTDVFDEFMKTNDLYKVALSDMDDHEILMYFIKASLPKSLIDDLYAIIGQLKNPLAIRSSSKLEDSHYQPFAGVYSTYMVPNVQNDLPRSVSLVEQAIKSVYASVFFKESKAYMMATSNVIDEEKMAIVLQEVCGQQDGDYFYPAISGVIQSQNYYPVDTEKPEDGIVNLAVGLGKYIMEGELALRFSPKHQKKIIQLSSVRSALQNTQKEFYALKLDPEAFSPSTNEGINLCRLKIEQIENSKLLRNITSTYDRESDNIRDGNYLEGQKVVTFSNILNYNAIPLAKVISDLITIGYAEMNRPIEIEFAVDLDLSGKNKNIFSFLQIRPVVESFHRLKIDMGTIQREDILVESDLALGSVCSKEIRDIVFIDPEKFNGVENSNTAFEIEKVNETLLKEKRPYILAGPGRWGSCDPWLGVPVKWAQISGAAVVIEYGIEGCQVEPSQGTHFFHNIIAFGVGYISINPLVGNGYIDFKFLNEAKTYHCVGAVKHLQFNAPLGVDIDGRSKRGLILKP